MSCRHFSAPQFSVAEDGDKALKPENLEFISSGEALFATWPGITQTCCDEPGLAQALLLSSEGIHRMSYKEGPGTKRESRPFSAV